MKQWKRVTGPDLCEWRHEFHAKNLNIFKSEIFIKACELAGLAKPTMRQASKWRRGHGLALEWKADAVKALEIN